MTNFLFWCRMDTSLMRADWRTSPSLFVTFELGSPETSSVCCDLTCVWSS